MSGQISIAKHIPTKAIARSSLSNPFHIDTLIMRDCIHKAAKLGLGGDISKCIWLVFIVIPKKMDY